MNPHPPSPADRDDEATIDLPASASGPFSSPPQDPGANSNDTVALPPSARLGRSSAMAAPVSQETAGVGGEATLPFDGSARNTGADLEATAAFQPSRATDDGATIAHTSTGAGGGFHVPPGAGGDGSRFQILRPHARGGLGEVFVAVDNELSREVALKEIQDRHADDPVSRTRFLLEAEVTGGLEHPGIVPVYGLGRYRDGRPYYAMRFIRGESLKDAIDRFHAADAKPGRDPGERELSLRALLRRFMDVCLAMDYAHSRSVIHRDIKPANIMLGPYGETLVVDWGLAKPLDRPPSEASAEDARPLRPMSASGNGQTLFGSTIGTPHFMSPEQAAGALDVMGPASDIYSLGATLYALLTGTVPFQDKTLGPLLDKVKRGEFPPPRQTNPSVPPALAAVTVKAMARKPEDRYATARQLADEIEHWMADEPVAAYPEPWTARARRWARRHRTAVTTAGALLVTAVLGLSIATVLINRERARTEAQRRIAQANFDLARDAVDSMLTELGAVELVDIPQAEGVRRQMLTKARDFYATFLSKHGKDPGLRFAAGQAFGRAGDILEMLGDYDNAEASYRNGLAILEPMAAAAATDDTRREVARLQHGLGVLLKKSLRFHEAQTVLASAVTLRRELARDDPDDGPDRKALSESVYMLGAVLARQENRGPEAGKLYDEAIAARRRMVEDARNRPEDRRYLARFLNNAGILSARSDRASAEATFREAATLQRELIGIAPNVPAYRWEFARSRSNLGNIFATARAADALKEYDAAVDLFAGLAEEYPSVPDYRYELAVARSNRALLRLNAGEAGPAEADLTEARRVLMKLTDEYPHRPDFQVRLGEANRRLAALSQKTSQLPKAAETLKAALASQRELVRRFPDVPEFRSILGATINDLGRLTAQTEGPAAGLTLFEEAAREQEAAMKGDPANATFREYLYNDLRRIAGTRMELKRYDDAVEALKNMARLKPENADSLCRSGRAIAMILGRAQGDPDLDDSQRALLRQKYQPEAIRLLRESVRHGMKDAAEFDHADYAPLRDVPEFQAVRDAVKAGNFAL